MRTPSEKSYREAVTLSPFRRAIYAVVAKIPCGQVMTYRAVAVAAGYPQAVRAVGTAMSGNRYQDVPCHRVVRTDGQIGEYAFGGPKAKRKRLEAEGIAIDARNRIVFPL